MLEWYIGPFLKKEEKRKKARDRLEWRENKEMENGRG